MIVGYKSHSFTGESLTCEGIIGKGDGPVCGQDAAAAIHRHAPALAVAPHLLDRARQERDQAVEACADLGMSFASQTVTLIRARRERDDLARQLTENRRDAVEARRLIELALHLRRHGENSPGGTETWAQFDREAETFLRWGAGGPEPEAPKMLYGRDAGSPWEHVDCVWPEKACTGHVTSYPPVQVPENTGKHPAEPDATLTIPDIRKAFAPLMECGWRGMAGAPGCIRKPNHEGDHGFSGSGEQDTPR